MSSRCSASQGEIKNSAHWYPPGGQWIPPGMQGEWNGAGMAGWSKWKASKQENICAKKNNLSSCSTRREKSYFVNPDWPYFTHRIKQGKPAISKSTMPIFSINTTVKLILNLETWDLFLQTLLKTAPSFLQLFWGTNSTWEKTYPLIKRVPCPVNVKRQVTALWSICRSKCKAISQSPLDASAANRKLGSTVTGACFFLSMQNICSPPQPKLCWSNCI